jgi:hypothetical protein
MADVVAGIGRLIELLVCANAGTVSDMASRQTTSLKRIDIDNSSVREPMDTRELEIIAQEAARVLEKPIVLLLTLVTSFRKIGFQFSLQTSRAPPVAER